MAASRWSRDPGQYMVRVAKLARDKIESSTTKLAAQPISVANADVTGVSLFMREGRRSPGAWSRAHASEDGRPDDAKQRSGNHAGRRSNRFRRSRRHVTADARCRRAVQDGGARTREVHRRYRARLGRREVRHGERRGRHELGSRAQGCRRGPRHQTLGSAWCDLGCRPRSERARCADRNGDRDACRLPGLCRQRADVQSRAHGGGHTLGRLLPSPTWCPATTSSRPWTMRTSATIRMARSSTRWLARPREFRLAIRRRSLRT